MAIGKEQGAEDWSFPDPKGMQGWLESEIADIQKAAELRIREATRFVNDYSRGEISKEGAEERHYGYSQRWGDVIPGVERTQGLTDEEILARLDEARDPKFVERVSQNPAGRAVRRKG